MQGFRAGSRMSTRKTAAHHLFSDKKKEKYYKRYHITHFRSILRLPVLLVSLPVPDPVSLTVTDDFRAR